MSKQKVEERVQEIKGPRTIKVSTVLISLGVITLIATAFIGGWIARSHDQGRITQEASAMVSQLKTQE